jgi:hypothetical protein
MPLPVLRFTGGKTVFSLALLAMVLLFFETAARAIPPPLKPEQLQAVAELVVEGQVTKVWRYEDWLNELDSGRLKLTYAGEPLTRKRALRLLAAPGEDDIDKFGVFMGQVTVEKTMKGRSDPVIFIPFTKTYRYETPRIIGGWSQPQLDQGARLRMYLEKNGPFYRAVHWNAYQPLPR